MKLKLIILSGLLLMLAACGGGSSPTPIIQANNQVKGVAAAGIIKGGTVKAFLPYSSATGADKKQIGNTATTSNTDGSYTINLGSYSGPVVVEVTGGSYVDEATNAPVAGGIPANAPLRAAIPATSGTVSLPITPLTELAVKQAIQADKKLGASAIGQANAQVSDLFKVDIINAKPLDASAPITGAPAADQNYTLALATLSQLSATQATSVDATLTSLANSMTASGNLSDAQVATDLTTALNTFVASPNNQTGVSTPPPALQNVGKTSVKVTLTLTGTGVRGVEAVMALPAGVTAAATGGLLDEAVFSQPTGGALTTMSGGYTAAAGQTPGSVHLLLSAAGSKAISAGDFVTLVFSLDAGATVPAASAFALSDVKLVDINGIVVPGATLTAK